MYTRARIIVTSNVRDFPAAALAAHGITAMPPDAFAVHLLSLDREGVLEALAADREDMRNPPLSADAHLDALARSDMPTFAAALRAFTDQI